MNIEKELKNTLPAEELGIKPEYKEYLAALAILLWEERIHENAFVMDIWYQNKPYFDGPKPPCGTVACIGGWGEVLFGARWKYDTSLEPLFLDYDYEDQDEITRKEAARAILRFLQGSTDPWRDQ